MSGSPAGAGVVRSSLATFGLSGTSMPASMASTVARRWTMSGIVLNPPGRASRRPSNGTQDLRVDQVTTIHGSSPFGFDGSGGQREALVALGGHLVARLAVFTDAARARHEDAGLAGHIGAHVPGVGLGIEGVAGDHVHVVDPGVLCLDGRLDRPQAVPFQVLDGV